MTRHENPDPQAVNGWPYNALDAALDAAFISEPIHDTFPGRKLALIPRGMEGREIVDPYHLPPRPKQRVTLDEAESLIAYAIRFETADSILVADIDAGKIEARIDYHSPDTGAGYLDHTATLALRPSEEFRRWDGFQGDMHSQEEFGRFLEENAVDIIVPDPATMIEISRDLEASQGASFKSKTRLENGDRAFAYETETKFKGQIVVPTQFTLAIPLFQGEQPVALNCLFRIRPTPEGLMMGFVWRRVEYMRREHFAAIAARVAGETSLPLYFGRLAGA